MNTLRIFCLLCPVVLFAQSREEVSKRFDSYINFKGSLNNSVQISDSGLSILSNGKPEFTAYSGEWAVITSFLTTQPVDKQVAFYSWKKNKRLSFKQLDSLSALAPKAVPEKNGKPLQGLKIAIDAGHMAGDMDMARLEQKFLDFYPTPENHLKDTVHISEGILTYQTAFILKHQLEEQGASVFMTRPQLSYCAFRMSYADWYASKRKKTLDSLEAAGSMTSTRKAQLLKMDQKKLFWEFFRDYELLERARIINAWKPDLCAIIHYNVNEKNTDWLNPSDKNFTMTFIGGAITADNLSKPANKAHLLRLLLSDQLNRSEKISSLTVNRFAGKLKIPIAKQTDADYLRDNCLKPASHGVYCRNLVLCRTVNAPLVYGECLYQDNRHECELLNKADDNIYGLTVPKRVHDVATCYYESIMEYFSKR